MHRAKTPHTTLHSFTRNYRQPFPFYSVVGWVNVVQEYSYGCWMLFRWFQLDAKIKWYCYVFYWCHSSIETLGKTFVKQNICLLNMHFHKSCVHNFYFPGNWTRINKLRWACNTNTKNLNTVSVEYNICLKWR